MEELTFNKEYKKFKKDLIEYDLKLSSDSKKNKRKKTLNKRKKHIKNWIKHLI